MMLTYNIAAIEQVNPFDGLTETLQQVDSVVLDGVSLIERYTFDIAVAESAIATAIETDLMAKGYTV